jgi:arylsulfatase A-like enzyme
MVAKYEKVPEDIRQGDPVYAAMVESVDESVGRVMATLLELGIQDRTTVIVTSDNGGFWKATNHTPLRGHKGTYWEGGIRVPLIIKWPGVSESGKVESTPVISTDLYPSILAMSGQDLIPHQHVDGLSLQPLLSGSGELPERSLYWHFPHYNNHPDTAPAGAIRDGQWKLIETFDPPNIELYDLANDLSESVNLADKIPDRARVLRNQLAQWRHDVGADEMSPNPGFAAEKKTSDRKKTR